jgi:hypothetical protein
MADLPAEQTENVERQVAGVNRWDYKREEEVKVEINLLPTVPEEQIGWTN